MEELQFSHQVAHEVAANWKTYADNYMEGYHIPLVHPRLNKEVDARRYRVEVGDRYCSHSAPARDGSLTSGKWLWRFPNLAINLYPDGMNVERFLPLGPRRTRIVYDYFFRDLSPAAQAENDEVVRLSLEVLDEDRAICEAVQRNLESGVYDTRPAQPPARERRWLPAVAGARSCRRLRRDRSRRGLRDGVRYRASRSSPRSTSSCAAATRCGASSAPSQGRTPPSSCRSPRSRRRATCASGRWPCCCATSTCRSWAAPARSRRPARPSDAVGRRQPS